MASVKVDVPPAPTSMKEIYADIEASKAALLPWSYSEKTQLFSHYQTQTYEFLETGVDEIVQVAHQIYSSQLARVNKGESPITLVAPGQSPSYLAFTMLNLPIYDPAKVNMIVLPMSGLKFRDPLNPSEQEWMLLYQIQMVKNHPELVISIQSNVVEDKCPVASTPDLKFRFVQNCIKFLILLFINLILWGPKVTCIFRLIQLFN